MELFDLYYESIRSFAYYKTGDAMLAEDIVQDTFMKLWDKRNSKFHDDTLKAYIYKIADNIIKNHYKHRMVVYNFILNSTPVVSSDPADHRLEQAEFNKLLNETLASVPEKSRVVFLMNRIEKLTYAEIAVRMGLSAKSIEKRMSDALAIIRNRINHRI